jgi:release factor glutamine methyltransferase
LSTVREILKKTTDWFASKGIDSPRLDAELLVARALGVNRLKLFMEPNRVLTDAELAASRELVRRRGNREPVAHILGSKEFLNFDFLVTPDTLIPRPETELLVGTAVEFLTERFGPKRRARRENMFDLMERLAKKEAEKAKAAAGENGSVRLDDSSMDQVAEAEASFGALETGPVAPAIEPALTPEPLFCDVGAGSGVVGISVALLFPSARGWGIDCCEKALAIAQANAERHKIAHRARMVHGSVYALHNGEALPERGLDLIVSNPPYIAAGEASNLAPEVLKEPAKALFGGEDGLEIIRPLIDEAPRWLKPGGLLALEIGWDQGPSVKSLMEQAGCWDAIAIKTDLAGRERVVSAKLKA